MLSFRYPHLSFSLFASGTWPNSQTRAAFQSGIFLRRPSAVSVRRRKTHAPFSCTSTKTPRTFVSSSLRKHTSKGQYSFQSILEIVHYQDGFTNKIPKILSFFAGCLSGFGGTFQEYFKCLSTNRCPEPFVSSLENVLSIVYDCGFERVCGLGIENETTSTHKYDYCFYCNIIVLHLFPTLLQSLVESLSSTALHRKFPLCAFASCVHIKCVGGQCIQFQA